MDTIIGFLPLLVMLAITIALLRRRLASGPPIVWTRGLVLKVALGVLGALAVPVAIAGILQTRVAA